LASFKLKLNRDEPPSKKHKIVRDKPDAIFREIKKEKLTFDEFICSASPHKDENNQPLLNICYVNLFIFFKEKHLTMIVECWYQRG